MLTVIFLTGVAAMRHHYSQVPGCPRATLFDGVSCLQ